MKEGKVTSPRSFACKAVKQILATKPAWEGGELDRYVELYARAVLPNELWFGGEILKYVKAFREELNTYFSQVLSDGKKWWLKRSRPASLSEGKVVALRRA